MATNADKGIDVTWSRTNAGYPDYGHWNDVNAGNIFEAYATCVFLQSSACYTNRLRSSMWWAVLADVTARNLLALYVVTKD